MHNWQKTKTSLWKNKFIYWFSKLSKCSNNLLQRSLIKVQARLLDPDYSFYISQYVSLVQVNSQPFLHLSCQTMVLILTSFSIHPVGALHERWILVVGIPSKDTFTLIGLSYITRFLDHSPWLAECSNMIDLGLMYILILKLKEILIFLLNVMSWEGEINLLNKIREIGGEF